MSAVHTALQHQDRASTLKEAIEPELHSLTNESVSVNLGSAMPDDSFPFENRFELKEYFVSKEWHRPYVEALRETDGGKLGVLIAQAERAILGRFLELLVLPDPSGEILDLQDAAYAIKQLKEACVAVNLPQHLVA
jgi:hypothetical protein